MNGISISEILGRITALLMALGGLFSPLSPNTATKSLFPSIPTVLDTRFSELTSPAAPSVLKDIPATPAKPELPAPLPAPTTVTSGDPSELEAKFGSAYEATAAATYNIFCTIQNGRNTAAISGTGTMIDPRGIILTNAHLAQFFLLTNASCTLRNVTNPGASFKAAPLFMPSRWLQAHGRDILAPNPTGTGEDDFALLAIQSRVLALLPLPDAFPYLRINTGEGSAARNSDVLLAGYPTGSRPITAERPPSLVVADASVRDFFGFSGASADLIAISSSDVGESGASGGPIVLADGSLGGIIVAANAPGAPAGEARALTLSYVSRDLASLAGQNLPAFLAGDIKTQLSAFAQEIPRLAAYLMLPPAFAQ